MFIYNFDDTWHQYGCSENVDVDQFDGELLLEIVMNQQILKYTLNSA